MRKSGRDTPPPPPGGFSPRDVSFSMRLTTANSSGWRQLSSKWGSPLTSEARGWWNKEHAKSWGLGFCLGADTQPVPAEPPPLGPLALGADRGRGTDRTRGLPSFSLLPQTDRRTQKW